MSALNAYISDLLYDHECVVLPGLGGIVGNAVSADYNKFEHEFAPPKKQLSFNKNLSANDGLLASKVSQEQGVSFDKAQELVQQFVTQIKRELNEVGFYDITDVGILELRTADKLVFHPNQYANYLKSAYGLRAVKVKPVVKPKTFRTEKEHEPIAVERPKRQPLTASRKAAFYYLPLVLSLLPILAYLIWIPTSTNLFGSGDFQLSDLNPFIDKKCAEYTPRTFELEIGLNEEIGPEETKYSVFNPKFSKQAYTHFYLFDRSEAFYNEKKPITVKLLAEAVAVADSTAVAKPNPIRVTSSQSAYHIIAGCFREKSNADALVNKLSNQGYAARILDVNRGLYRVSIGGFYSKRQAIDTLPKLRTSVNQGAWVVKK